MDKRKLLFEITYFPTREDARNNVEKMTTLVWAYDYEHLWELWDDSNEEEGFHGYAASVVGPSEQLRRGIR